MEKIKKLTVKDSKKTAGLKEKFCRAIFWCYVSN